MGRIELDDALFATAASAAAAAATVMYATVAGKNDEDGKEAALCWFAGGLVRDRDQDADLDRLARYATELRREPETLFRKAVELGAIEGAADDFEGQPAPVRLAYEIFVETARSAAVILDDQLRRELKAPVVERGPVKVEDTIFERSDTDSGQDAARLAGVDAAAAAEEQAAKDAEAAKAKAAKPNRSKGRTKADRSNAD